MRSAAARQQLWAELADLLAEDDGSLPEMRLTGASNEGVERAYAALLQRAEPLGADETAWDFRRDMEAPLVELPHAARLAAQGEGTLHVILSGIHSDGIRLPDLGVSVFPGELAPTTGWGTGGTRRWLLPSSNSLTTYETLLAEGISWQRANSTHSGPTYNNDSRKHCVVTWQNRQRPRREWGCPVQSAPGGRDSPQGRWYYADLRGYRPSLDAVEPIRERPGRWRSV